MKDRKTRIGITVRYCRVEEEEIYKVFEENTRIQKVFAEIAERHGVTLIPIMWAEDMSDACSLCDGLIISGSDIDVDPSYFDPALPFSSGDYDEYHYNRKLIEIFLKDRKPIFGICSGLQELNIFLGGSIVQDMDGHGATRHDIETEPGSKLAELFGGSLNTNSFHHQCIDRLAPVLKATARSADGVVEAVELPGAEVMGVQWHPEFDVPQTREKLFAAFFSACAKYGEQ